MISRRTQLLYRALQPIFRWTPGECREGACLMKLEIAAAAQISGEQVVLLYSRRNCVIQATPAIMHVKWLQVRPVDGFDGLLQHVVQ